MGDWQADPVQAVLTRLLDALLTPLAPHFVIFYRHDAPLIGWPEAMLLVLGTMGLLAALGQTRNWPAVAWVAVPALTFMASLGAVDMVQPHRLLLISPLWALVIGVGVVLVARWVAAIPIDGLRHLPVDRVLVAGGVAVLLAINLPWVYSNERTLSNWGDERTVAAWDLGWRLVGDDAPVVLLAGPPFVLANSSPAFTFQAPNVTVVEVWEPMEAAPDVPELTPGVVLVVVPERLGERCAIAQAVPGAAAFEVRAAGGNLLYLLYGTVPVTGWSLATSPAGTTVTMVGADECEVTGIRPDHSR